MYIQMVDSSEEYRLFLEKNKHDDLFVHVVLTEDKHHPAISNVSVVLIKNFRSEELYHFTVDHQDSPHIILIEDLINDISEFKGRLFSIDKKQLTQAIPFKNTILDINLGLHLNGRDIINVVEFETAAHKYIQQNCNSYTGLNKVIPLTKHRELVDNVFEEIKSINEDKIFDDPAFLKTNSEILDTLSEVERNGIFVDYNVFKTHFDVVPYEGLVYSQYNVYTSTGRPSNRYGGVNYAALTKDDGCRDSFVSRFGVDGTMVMIDYSSFHPRIICELTNFKLPNDIDFYVYMAKLCFKKEYIDQSDIDSVKTLTFRLLYGNIDEEHAHIQFFYNLKGFKKDHWDMFVKDGYIKTPIFGRKIKNKHITDPNPNKLFNYILQATETEIAVPILSKVNKFLRDKLSKPVLYTYDSVLFDVHLSELDIIKNDVLSIMTDGDRFPVKFYIGDSYGAMERLNI